MKFTHYFAMMTDAPTWHVLSKQALIRRLDCYQTLEGHDSRIYTIRFNPTGSLLISGAGDANVKIWNWLDGKQKFAYPHGHQDSVMDAQFLPFTNDRMILTSSFDGLVSFNLGFMKLFLCSLFPKKNVWPPPLFG